MCSSKWSQASDKLVSCLHCLGCFLSLIKISLWKDAVFFGVFWLTPVFEKESKPHGTEYCRHKSLRCPPVFEVTSICGVNIIITGLSNASSDPEPRKHELLIIHHCVQHKKSNCFSYPSSSSLFFQIGFFFFKGF